jgi:hypothetical protein
MLQCLRLTAVVLVLFVSDRRLSAQTNNAGHGQAAPRSGANNPPLMDNSSEAARLAELAMQDEAMRRQLMLKPLEVPKAPTSPFSDLFTPRVLRWLLLILLALGAASRTWKASPKADNSGPAATCPPLREGGAASNFRIDVNMAAHSPRPKPALALIVPFTAEHCSDCVRMAQKLRAAGIGVDVYAESREVGQQLENVKNQGYRFALIAGSDEFAAKTWTIKDLGCGEERTVAEGDVVAALRGAGL